MGEGQVRGLARRLGGRIVSSRRLSKPLKLSATPSAPTASKRKRSPPPHMPSLVDVTVGAGDEFAHDRRIVIYPSYINANSSLPKGRKVSREFCVEHPTLPEILEVLKVIWRSRDPFYPCVRPRSPCMSPHVFLSRISRSIFPIRQTPFSPYLTGCIFTPCHHLYHHPYHHPYRHPYRHPYHHPSTTPTPPPPAPPQASRL